MLRLLALFAVVALSVGNTALLEQVATDARRYKAGETGASIRHKINRPVG